MQKKKEHRHQLFSQPGSNLSKITININIGMVSPKSTSNLKHWKHASTLLHTSTLSQEHWSRFRLKH